MISLLLGCCETLESKTLQTWNSVATYDKFLNMMKYTIDFLRQGYARRISCYLLLHSGNIPTLWCLGCCNSE